MLADRRDLRHELYRLASRQGGHFTAGQAKKIGYSYQAQFHHARVGNWDRVDRGLYRLAEWIPGPLEDLARWTLWSKGRAVISHESALAVHDLGEFESSRVHLTVPPKFTMRDAALTLHLQDLPETDVEDRTGFKVTNPVRSIIDVATQLPDTDQLARAIDEALERGLATSRALRTRSEMVDVRAALHIERALQQAETP